MKESRMKISVKLFLTGFFVLFLAVILRAEEFQKPDPNVSPTLLLFKERLPIVEKQIPLVVKCAETSASRMLKNPKALINVPYGEQASFAEEMLNRAGGIANTLPDLERPSETTPDDILLFSLRSWEKDWPKQKELVLNHKKKGWLVVLFASKAGAPEDLPVDFLIDNGATSGSEEQAAVNTIVNIVNGWLWCCEYVSALSRLNKCPGILKGAAGTDAEVNNVYLQSREGRHWIGDASGYVPVSPGVLSAIYMKHVKEIISAVSSERVQGQIAKSADVISNRIVEGKKVGVTGIGHIMLFEQFLNNKSPWKPFYVVWRARTAFKENVTKGDLLVFFGYIGMSTMYEDYDKYIRETGADVIASFIPDSNPDNNAPYAIGHIEQSWQKDDACVTVPCPPGRMAPISGVNMALLFRMLDDAVAERLAVMEKAGKYKPQPVPDAGK